MPQSFSSLAFAVLAGLWALPAQASPFVYISTSAYVGSLEQCLDSAAEAIRLAGFTRQPSRQFSQQAKGGTVQAWLPNSAMIAKIECAAGLGTSTLVVSGLDRDPTHERYSALFEIGW